MIRQDLCPGIFRGLIPDDPHKSPKRPTCSWPPSPLAGKRITQVTAHKTKIDWARFLEKIAADYPQAEKITLVIDNLNTHRPGTL